MYERNAIVIDRYFASIFGYDNRNNLKNNSSNYFELVNSLENYQEASETENNIMREFESVASQIKETQKLQEVLNKRNLKYSEARRALFESLDEEPEVLKKKFEKLDDEINRNNQEIKSNSEKFVEEIADFNEKSETRSICGRERRIVENEYQKILTSTTDNFNNISREKLKEAKTFVKSENKKEAKQEIKEKISKNGAKEKVPFDQNVITTAIDTSTYIEEKRAEILLSLYDKTNKLLDEIKNDTVRIERHKKIVTDSKCKLEFLNVISEYIILFLDNERMNTMGGEAEHHKIMKDACNNLQSDLIEIQNMYSLLIKEITGKSSKKAYKELYNIQYMADLKEEEKMFEKSISKINMVGTVVYPDYWRVEGMQKIYDTFKHIITDVYGKDLSEYEPLDITFAVNAEALTDDEEDTEDSEALQDQAVNSKETEATTKETQETSNSEEVEASNSEKVKTSKGEKQEENPEKQEEQEEQDDEDEFFWDEDDEDDELIFSTEISSTDSEDDEDDDNEENEVNTVNEEQQPSIESHQSEESNIKEQTEEERDKEIDEILGFFDNEDDEEDEEKYDEEVVITGEEDDDQQNEDDDLDEDKIFDAEEDEDDEDDEDDEIEQEIEETQRKKEKREKKKRGLFARRGK